MTPRNIRRAAERKAAKLARKAGNNVDAAAPISPAQQAANQANAQFSTGPRTETGKQASSRNALKTGLTGQTVLLPTDDLAAYELLLKNTVNRFQPDTEDERALVQSIVDTNWRLQRIVNLEFAIYAKGSTEFADQFDNVDPATRSQLILAETYLKYEKSIRNLNTQEARLQRRLSKDTAELNRLREERLQFELAREMLMAKRTAQRQQPESAPENGFEFSTTEFTDPDDLESLATAA